MTPRLSAVPDRPRRVLGIIRVSEEREGMISPDTQRTAIETYCQARGHQLVDVVEGLDQSGSQRRSAWWPTLDRAVAAVEAGEYDGLVVWKFSRTARHRLRWAVALDRVETAGGILESATEQFDTSTSAGRFARGMIAEMNAFEAERIGEVWSEAHQKRVRSGRPHSGAAKWGYRYDREQRLHVPHPEQGPVLADLYRRYVAGESIYQLVRWLNGHGWRTTADGPWSEVSLRRLLDSGFAAGLFSYRGVLHDGVHEPLIDKELWQAFLDARGARRQIPARVERSQYLLSGLVRCARCGFPMVANRQQPGTRLSRRTKGRAAGKRYSNGTVRYVFRCARGKETGGCPGGTVSMGVVEEFVLEWLRGVAAQVDEEVEQVPAPAPRRTSLEAEERRVAAELARIDEALVRLALRDAERPMSAGAYAQARDELEGKAAELRAVLETVGRESRRAAADPRATAVSLLGEWDEMPVAGRRETLRGLLDCVLVRPGREGGRWMRVVEWVEVRG